MTDCGTQPLNPKCTCKTGWDQVYVPKDAVSSGNPSMDIWVCCGPGSITADCKAGRWTPNPSQQKTTARINEKQKYFPPANTMSQPKGQRAWCNTGYVVQVIDSTDEITGLKCVKDPNKWYLSHSSTAPIWADDITVSHPTLCGDQYKTCCASGTQVCAESIPLESPTESPTDTQKDNKLVFIFGGIIAVLLIILVIAILTKFIRS